MKRLTLALVLLCGCGDYPDIDLAAHVCAGLAESAREAGTVRLNAREMCAVSGSVYGLVGMGCSYYEDLAECVCTAVGGE